MLRRLAGWIEQFSFVWLLAAAPFLLFPAPGRSLALLALPLLWAATWWVRGTPVPRTPFNLPLLGLSLMMLVSVFATYSIEVSLPKLGGLLLGLGCFWELVHWVAGRRRLAWAVAAYLVAGAGLAVLALLGTDWPPKFALFEPIVQVLPRLVRNLPGAQDGFQPNVVGGVLLLFVPLQVALLARPTAWSAGAAGWDWPQRRWWLAAQLGLLALTTAALALTQSRGAWLGLLMGLAVLTAWHGPRARRILALGLGVTAVIVLLLGPQAVWGQVSGGLGPDVGLRLDSRWAIWQRGLYGVLDFPLTGMGLNAFRYNQLSLYPMYLMRPTLDLAHAHNHLLQAALDLGLPGLIAYLALWLGAGCMLWRARQVQPEAWVESVSGGLTAGLAAHFVFSLSDAIPLGARAGLVFWLALALVTGLYRVVVNAAPGGLPALSVGSTPP